MCVPKYFGVEPCFLLNRNLDTANYKYIPSINSNMQRTVSAVIFHKAFVDRELTDRDRNTGWVEELGNEKGARNKVFFFGVT